LKDVERKVTKDKHHALHPKKPTADEHKIDALLNVLTGVFEDDSDLDLVRDLAFQRLLMFPQLPPKTIEIMLAILADEGDSDLVLTRQIAAIGVLAHMGPMAQPALATLTDLLPLAESDYDSKRWLALRASKAIWQITGDPEAVFDVAEKLADDGQFWLVIQARELLLEIGSL
jgi:hypothetical protein